MKNIIIKEPGGPEVLTVAEVGIPTPGHGQVLIKVSAAGVNGRIAVISGLKGWKTEIDCRSLMVKRLMLTGSTLRPMPVAYKAAIARNLEKHIWPFIGNGRIKPVIYKKLPLEQAAEAHAIMESSAHIGKILLIP